AEHPPPHHAAATHGNEDGPRHSSVSCRVLPCPATCTGTASFRQATTAWPHLQTGRETASSATCASC
ncbi:MAG: hypothetical protein ACK559_31645, partial [bacterium]